VAGPKSWAVTAGKLVQATLKAQLFQQLSCEIQELRDKGKIPAHQNSCIISLKNTHTSPAARGSSANDMQSIFFIE
jgi:hypothetical protein